MAEDLEGGAEEPTLQDRLVLKGTVYDTHYEVGQLPVGDGRPATKKAGKSPNPGQF